jgi:hypothetical protein
MYRKMRYRINPTLCIQDVCLKQLSFGLHCRRVTTVDLGILTTNWAEMRPLGVRDVVQLQIAMHMLRETFYLNVSNAHQIVRQKNVRLVTPVCLSVRSSVYGIKTTQKREEQVSLSLHTKSKRKS